MKKLVLFIVTILLFPLFTKNIYAQVNLPNGCVQVDSIWCDPESAYTYHCGNVGKPFPQPSEKICCNSERSCLQAQGIIQRCPGTSHQGINTALGCIPFDDRNATIQFFFRWGIGIAGGIAVLLIIYAGYIISTSSGDPRRLQGGQQLLTSAIAGIIMIVFSIFLLRMIGVNILSIF